jgi:short-subunit dehydrogenase
VSRRLAGRGARLVLVGRDRGRLAELARSTGGRAIAVDLTTSSEARRAADEAVAAVGRVDVLVNNAGLGWSGRFPNLDVADVERLLAVNLQAPIVLTRALLPAMLARGRGHVVNVASIAGHTGVKHEAVYAATKAGLVAFSESLRQELRGRGVGVSLVTPGVIATPFFERRGSPYARRWPRPIAPERVADAVVSAIERDVPEVYVPRWMAGPARLQGAWPRLYRALASRWG